MKNKKMFFKVGVIVILVCVIVVGGFFGYLAYWDYKFTKRVQENRQAVAANTKDGIAELSEQLIGTWVNENDPNYVSTYHANGDHVILMDGQKYVGTWIMDSFKEVATGERSFHIWTGSSEHNGLFLDGEMLIWEPTEPGVLPDEIGVYTRLEE